MGGVTSVTPLAGSCLRQGEDVFETLLCGLGVQKGCVLDTILLEYSHFLDIWLLFMGAGWGLEKLGGGDEVAVAVERVVER